MNNFEYEWWDIDIKDQTGVMTWEFRAKNKENAIKQIKAEVTKINSGKVPFAPKILEIYWDTMVLDHKGFQRLW